MLAGVAGGIAHTYGFDPALVRLAFVERRPPGFSTACSGGSNRLHGDERGTRGAISIQSPLESKSQRYGGSDAS